SRLANTSPESAKFFSIGVPLLFEELMAHQSTICVASRKSACIESFYCAIDEDDGPSRCPTGKAPQRETGLQPAAQGDFGRLPPWVWFKRWMRCSENRRAAPLIARPFK